jgi:2-keto-4-pentenoate hydratase/2-oxohepta-3-ene-1,7-dioic acid hydratase in catechol pathway
MKLASFKDRGATRVAAIDGDHVLALDFPDMIALIERFGEVGAQLESAVPLPLSEVDLIAPIPCPRRNIICVGKNYRDHAREFSQSGFEAGAIAGKEIDNFPAVFTKLPTSVTGPGATVSLHAHVTSSVDYEAELAIVIGKAGRDIPHQNAFDHIFGYTVINDVTARDRQKNHKQWFLGKTLDGFCPMGPWITTADEVDAENLDIKCWVNGELRQSANTRDLIFDIPTLVATISAGTTLLPGDIIATGTPAGVGIGFDPPKFLRSGDTVSVSISGLGELFNTFR